jgi:hypothetical protein
MGRIKKDGNHSPSKKYLIHNSVGNEENGYPVLESTKTKINDIKEPNDVHKNILKEEIQQMIPKNFMEMILDMIYQNMQEELKKFQDTKNKEYEETQKQINELIEALNKLQCEIENTINREINELKVKIDNINEEVTHDVENLRRKNETETQNKVEGHSSRLQQMEHRISKLESKMEIKGKIEELLVK